MRECVLVDATWFSIADSPIGPLVLAADDTDDLVAIDLGGMPDPRWKRDDDRLEAARRQLDEYFAGERREFDLATRLQGSPFQLRVWEALREIPYGETASYGEIARRIDYPGSARAVGGANHRNPLPIIVPCHRVIGANRSLTGYGGGLDRKAWLLAHEGATPFA